MTRYRKKPVEVEAWQIGSDELEQVEWFDLKSYITLRENSESLKGAWIIKFTNGSFNVVSNEEFKRTYEPVRPYYEDVYEWAFSGMEGCDGPEYEMLCKIIDAIADYVRQDREEMK